MNSAGTAIAAWTNDQLMVSMYFAGSGWTPSYALNSAYPYNYFPDVAISDGGNATVVWCAWGSPYDILADRYVAGSGWESPVLLNALAYDPKVAMDDEGNAIVVYRDANGPVQNVWAVRFDALHGWEVPVRLQDSGGDVDGVAIAMDDSGNAIAVWAELIGSRYVVMASRCTPGANWSVPERIDSSEYSASLLFDIAVDPLGNAVVSWVQSRDDTGKDLWANVYIAGVGWGRAELIENGELPEVGPPDVSMNNKGEAVVTWTWGDWGNGTVYDVYVNRYEPGVGWSSPTVVEDDRVNPAYASRAEIDNQGEVVVVWYAAVLDPFSVEIRSTRYTEEAGWGDCVVVGICSPYHGMTINMAMDGLGNAVVVWNDSGAKAARYEKPGYPGSVWDTPQLLESDDRGSVSAPEIAIDDAGNCIAVWDQYDGVQNNIWANRFSPVSGWGTATLLENDDSGPAYSPKTAMDNSGNAFVVWTQYNGTLPFAWAIRHVAGAGWEPPQRISSNPLGLAGYANIACDNVGNAFAV
jgi:hypothetical protein